MAEKVEVDIDVNTNADEAGGKVASLKTQLREARIAFEQLQNSGKATAAELKKAADKIDDISDKIDRAKFSSGQFEDKLAALPGPLGKIGGGLKAVGDSFATFGKSLTISLGIVGLLVSAFFAIKEALGKTEEGTKLLSQATSAFNKVLAPLLAIFENLGQILLPILTKGLEALGGVMNKVAKFFGASDTAIKQTTASLEKNNEAAKKLAEDEKERVKKAEEAAAKGEEARKKRLEEKKKLMEAQDKLDIAALEKLKAEALAVATTEQQKFDVEKQFADKLYALRLKDLQDKLALEKVGTAEYKSIQADITKLQAEKIASDTEFAKKGLDIIKKAEEDKKKANDEAKNQAELDLQLQREKGLIDEAQYQQALYDTRVKYANSTADTIKAEIDLLKYKNEEKSKKLQEEREITALNIQGQIEELDRLNDRVDNDFKQDLERLAQKRKLTDEAEKNELANTKLTEKERTEVRKKYADARADIAKQEVDTEKAAQEAKVALQLEYIDLYAQFGQLLGQIAGKNKAVAIAGLLIEKAAAVAKIITQMNSVPAILPPGIPNPSYLPSRIGGALSIASVIAATVKGIQQINQVDTTSKSGGGAATGAQAPPPTYTGAPAAMMAPQVQTTQGVNASSQIAQTIGASQAPVRAYVVSQEMSSQQALDRRTNVAATFSGG